MSGASDQRFGQRIPNAGEAEAGEVGLIERGKLGHAMMPQGEREPGVEDDAASHVRLASPVPHVVHHAGRVTGIINQFPAWMLAELVNDGDGVGRIQRVLDRIARGRGLRRRGQP